MTRGVLWWLLAGGFWVLGCEPRAQQTCRMADEYTVATVDGRPVALTSVRVDDRRVQVIFSSGEKTFVASVDNMGRPVGDMVELVNGPAEQQYRAKTFWPRDKGGNMASTVVSAVRIWNGTAVCMLNPGAAQGQFVPRVAVVADDTREIRIIEVGPVVSHARRLSCGVQSGQLIVAFDEQFKKRSYISLARVSKQEDDVALFRHRVEDAWAPSLAMGNDAETLMVYGGMEDEKKGVYAVRVTPDMQLDLRVRIDDVSMIQVDPNVLFAQDHFAVVFRDDRDGDGMPEFYFGRLSVDNGVVVPPQRISRADGPRGPVVSRGTRSFYSAQIRSYRSNYLVGLNRFDKLGTKRGGEFQVYADKCDFTRVTIDVRDDAVLLMYAEESHDDSRIIAASVFCRH